MALNFFTGLFITIGCKFKSTPPPPLSSIAGQIRNGLWANKMFTIYYSANPLFHNDHKTMLVNLPG